MAIKNWTVLSSGNRDLLHLALASCAWIGADHIPLERFDGTLDRKATLIAYLARKRAEQSVSDISMVIYDQMYMKRQHRFSVPDYFFFEGCVKNIGNFNVLILPSVPITSEPKWKCVGRDIHYGQIDVNITTSAMFVTPRGAAELHDALVADTALPDMFYFRDPVITEYQWDYGEGRYD